MKSSNRSSFLFLNNFFIFIFLFYFSFQFISINYLTNHDDKLRRINLGLIRIEGKVLYSIIVSTKNRKNCFQHVFEKLMKCRPNSTEIVVVDDCSTEPDKIEYLKQIKDYSLVKIIHHNHSYGAFHAKVDGFKSAKGKYLMSSDDDDDFDCEYYQEIVEHIDPNYDIIVPLNNFLKKYFDVHTFYSIDQYISNFHNHVAIAFRKELIDNVEYPSKNVTIIRDDAVITIPLYFQTNISKLLRYENKYYYKLAHFCPIHHESSRYKSNLNSIRNGLIYLKKMVKEMNKEEYGSYVDQAYQGYLPSLNITGFDYVYTAF